MPADSLALAAERRIFTPHVLWVAATFMQRLRRMSCPFLLVAVSLCIQACSRQTSVSGQVFVTVNAGSSIKLGGVDVLALSRADLAAALLKNLKQEEAEGSRVQGEVEAAEAVWKEAQKKENALLQAQLDAPSREEKASLERRYLDAQRETRVALEKRNAAVERFNSWPTVERYFTLLPKPIASATTNADGFFSIVVPTRERFALAAHATREVGYPPEEYFWLIWIDPREKNDSILFTNRNCVNLLAPESVWKTWAEATR